MTLLSQQTFSQDIILDKLVDYFNGLPAEQRTIGAHDFPVYKITVSSNGEQAEPVFTCDGTPVSDESYIGEASFIWCGPRGYPVTSNRDHFHEISKYIAPSVEMRVGSTHIQWRAGGTMEWQDLIALASLMPAGGTTGQGFS